jgi:hypothetical protein
MTINNIQLSNGQNILYTIQGSEIRIAWADLAALQLSKNDVLLNITATINSTVNIENYPITVNHVSEIANYQAIPYESITIGIPTLTSTTTNVNGVVLAQINVRNFPNPFTNMTTIEYELPTLGEVSIIVYDQLGRQITTLINERQTKGVQQVSVNAKDWASGNYFYTITVTNDHQTYKVTKQMLLTK